MYSRDKAYQRGKVERFEYLRNKIVSEFRNEKFYDKRNKPLNNDNPRLWWKK